MEPFNDELLKAMLNHLSISSNRDPSPTNGTYQGDRASACENVALVGEPCEGEIGGGAHGEAAFWLDERSRF